MLRRSRILLAGLLVAALPTSASALDCEEWTEEAVNWTCSWYQPGDGPALELAGFSYFSDEYQIAGDANPGTEPIDPNIAIEEIVDFSGSSFANLFQITIPNFFDPLPDKQIDIVIHGVNLEDNAFLDPLVLAIEGADAPFTEPGPAQPVYGFRNSRVILDDTPQPGQTTITELWFMEPNPDFETVKIFAPLGFEIESIHIKTQSLVIPEPSTVALLGAGLVGIGVMGRRRRDA